MEWEKSIANPGAHPEFLQAYANELRDALVKSNRRRKAAKEAMEQLTNADWNALIKRELQTEDWFAASDQQHEEESATRETPLP